MAKKEPVEEGREDKQEQRQTEARKEKPKPQPVRPVAPKKQETAPKKQGAKRVETAKKRDLPKPQAKENAKPARKEVAKQKNSDRPKADNRKEGVKQQVAENKAKAARQEELKNKAANKAGNGGKPMPQPGKRPGAGQEGEGKKKIAGRPEDRKGKGASDPKDTNKIARKSDKPAKRMELPGKRPKVSEAEKTARAERLQKEANKRKAEQRLEEERKRRKAETRVAEARQGRDRREAIVRAGQNTKKVRRPDVRNRTENNWWNTTNNVTNNRITNKDVRIRNTTVNNTVINRNFERNVNWTTRKRDWGYNPWWNRPQTRPWYGSSWNGRWNRNYYHANYRHGYADGYHDGYRPPGYGVTSVGAAIGWGLVGWSLGSMVYNSGYQTYHNPYPVSRSVSYGSAEINYTQPITRVAVETAPEDTTVIAEKTARSESIIADSQNAFRERNYLVALELADKAIAETPGDGALHEYRALVLFSLGKYGDAAGVLNPVLASGPGWDWSTMIALYDSQQTYTDQLQRLETYSEAHPDSADTHFLLGYHYMVCGHTDLATPQFDLAAKLMPADSVSRQLAELTSASAVGDDDAEDEVPTAAEIEELPAPEPVSLEKLTGTWTSTRDDGSTVTLKFAEDGKFTWSYAHDGKTSEFSGDYSMNDDGLLVLDSEDSQMVATVGLPQEREMSFVLAGGPPDDPGLDFKKG